MQYFPEGVNASLRRTFSDVGELKEAIRSREVYEAPVIRCDSAHNLYVSLGAYTGIIPKNEGALGIIEGTVRDIALISKVGRRVCFRVAGLHRNGVGGLMPVLSRRSVQLDCRETYINRLEAGDIISAKVTRLEPFGAFIDIGAGINALIPIEMLSVSRINHPRERLYTGQLIKAVLLRREEKKLTFSLRELLGTWEENAAMFEPGETVTGVVRSVEPYGVFVELTPNLAGLAEPCDEVRAGQRVSVFIKSIAPQRMKMKLTIVDAFEENAAPPEINYFVQTDRIDVWRFSPRGATKNICTYF